MELEILDRLKKIYGKANVEYVTEGTFRAFLDTMDDIADLINYILDNLPQSEEVTLI